MAPSIIWSERRAQRRYESWRRPQCGAAFGAQQEQRQIRWEVNRIRWTLAHLDVKLVLLKGAAYVMSQLPTADGRIVSDSRSPASVLAPVV